MVVFLQCKKGSYDTQKSKLIVGIVAQKENKNKMIKYLLIFCFSIEKNKLLWYNSKLKTLLKRWW